MPNKRTAKKKPAGRKQAGDEHALPSLSLVFGYIAVKNLDSISDKVRVLSQLGYGNPEMAKICDTSVNTVAVTKSTSAKRKK